jgi:hypothetical protein
MSTIIKKLVGYPKKHCLTKDLGWLELRGGAAASPARAHADLRRVGSRPRGSARRRWRIGSWAAPPAGSRRRQRISEASALLTAVAELRRVLGHPSAAPLLPFFARLCSPSPLLYAGPRGASFRGLIPHELPARSSSSTTAPRPHRRPCVVPPSLARSSSL